MKKKYGDIIAGSVLFVLGLVYFIMAFSIKRTYIDRVVGSRMFPQICGGVLMGLAALLIIHGVTALRGQKKEALENKKEEQEREEKGGVIGPAMKTVLVLVSFGVFAWLLDKIGFTAASILYLFSQMVLMDNKKITKKYLLFYMLLSIVLSAGLYLLFYEGFSLILPKASWF